MKKPRPLKMYKDGETHVEFWSYNGGPIEAVAVAGCIVDDKRLDRLIKSLIEHRDWLKRMKKSKGSPR